MSWWYTSDKSQQQKQATLAKHNQLQAQDRLQQLVNDTSARYFAEIESILGQYFKNYQPRYAQMYAADDQGIQKRVSNIEMAVLTLKIQTNQASKDPGVPPIKVCHIPAGHLDYTTEAAGAVPNLEMRAFLLENLQTFRTQVARDKPVEVPQEFTDRDGSVQVSTDHSSAHDQQQLMGLCNQAHDLGDHIESRIQKQLPADDRRYEPSANPLITKSEARGVINSHQNYSKHTNGHMDVEHGNNHQGGHNHQPNPAYTGFSAPPAYKSRPYGY